MLMLAAYSFHHDKLLLIAIYKILVMRSASKMI